MGDPVNRTVGEFKVQAFYQGKFTDVTREDTLEHWSVPFFYSAGFTFVRPVELGNLADFYEEFKVTGCEIYLVSKDTRFVHEAWADASDTIKRVQYPILGDSAGKLAREFSVPDEEEGQVFRGAFILSLEGRIKAYEAHDMGVGRNAQELLCKVQVAWFVEERGDQACLIKWKSGEETLTPGLDLVGMLQGGGGYD